MTQSTAVDEAPETTPVEEVEPDRTEARLFRFSEHLHVGAGAAECEDRENGKCSDPEHFHAYLRLPNKFQAVQIKEKAQAARARVLRQARDPQSDRHAIIENQVEEIRLVGREAMIAELLGRDEYRWHNQAMRELVDEEDSPFATVEEDQKRWRHLTDLGAEERDEDEYQELTRHLEHWNDAVDERYQRLMQPQKDALDGQSDDELAEQIRVIAINEQADGIFMRTFTKWQMVVCVMKPRAKGTPSERVFDNPAELEGTAPEIVASLEEAFKDLELELAERTQLRAEGN